MNPRRLAPCAALLALGLVLSPQAHADSSPISGVFTADNSTYELTFGTTSPTNYTFSTTSYATGGFVPVLTLFNDTTGAEIANDGTGLGDVSISEFLTSGTYDLFLTEFPNVAVGDLSAGFLLAGYPTATGDACSITGGMFRDVLGNCAQRSDSYTLSENATAVTPEPSTWLLVLPPAAYLFATRRRRSA